MKGFFLFLFVLIMGVFACYVAANGQTPAATPVKVGTVWYVFDNAAKASSYYTTYSPQDTVVKYIPPVLPIVTPTDSVIWLNAGNQPGPDATGKSNIRYKPKGGVVTFTSAPKIGKSTNVTFDGSGIAGQTYGFVIGFTGYSVFLTGQGGIVGFSTKNIDFGNGCNMVFDGVTKIYVPGTSNMITWDGTPGSAVFYHLTVDSFSLGPRTSLLQGAWDNPLTYRMYNVDINISHGKKFNAPNDLKQSYCIVHGLGIFGLHVDGVDITGTTGMDSVDYGIFFWEGSGWVKNVHRDGGYGYVVRLVPKVLGGLPATIDQTTGLWNTVDVNSTRYGTIDCLMKPADYTSTAPITITGTDVYFMNNTSGNKTDGGYYVTNAVVLGDMLDNNGKQFGFHIQNSLAFNAALNNGSGNTSLLKRNSLKNNLDTANNIDLPAGKAIAAGYLDPNYYPIPGTTLAKSGIGAQYPKGVTPPAPCPICPICQPITITRVTFDGQMFVITDNQGRNYLYKP